MGAHLVQGLASVCVMLALAVSALGSSSSTAATAATASAATATAGPATPGAGEEAYRRGDYTTARELWEEELGAAASAQERARLCYNCGNACYREGKVLEAVAWYTAGLRHSPRDGDLWYNLELARAEAGLEPADRGDLEATTRRVLGSLTPTESDWIVLSLLVVLALCLTGEALRGGAWRGLSAAAAGLLVLATIPWTYTHWSVDERALMIVAKGEVAARSEPRPDAKRLSDLAPGELVLWRDSLPGWVKVDVSSTGELWIPDKSVFELVR